MDRFFQDVEADSERTMPLAVTPLAAAAEQGNEAALVFGDMEDDSVALAPARSRR
jgi:hypothetical protein